MSPKYLIYFVTKPWTISIGIGAILLIFSPLYIAHAVAPVAVDEAYSTDAETIITFENVLLNDTDGDGDSLTAVAIVNGAGSNGGIFNLTASGTLTFDPDGDFDDLLGTNDQPAASLADDLLAYWTFDRADFAGTTTLLDKSGNGSDGVLSSFATVTRAVGRIGQALTFDGIDDRVTVTASNTLDLSEGNVVSIFAWIKRVSEEGNAGVIFDNRQYILQTRGGSFRVQHNESNGDVYIADVDSPLASDGEWHHYGQVYNGSATVVYVDGAVVSTTPVVDGGTDGSDGGGLGYRGSNHNGYIGNAATFGASSFGGQIDDIRIYSRAITPTEVTSLYQIGANAQQATTSIDYVVTDGAETATGTVVVTLTDISYVEPEDEEVEETTQSRRGNGVRISLSEKYDDENASLNSTTVPDSDSELSTLVQIEAILRQVIELLKQINALR